MRLRGKPGTTFQYLSELLNDLRKNADGASLGLATSLKVLLSLITCHFDEKAEKKTAYMDIATWRSFVLTMLVLEQ